MWKKWLGKTEQQKLPADIDSGLPRHLAISLDGNDRWIAEKKIPRASGHMAGAEALREIIRTVIQLKIPILTVYAFSTNWNHPQDEDNVLMNLFSTYLDANIDELDSNDVQLRFIGKLQDLSSDLYDKFLTAQKRTEGNNGLILTAAINYGGRAEITDVIQKIATDVQAGLLLPDKISEDSIQQRLYTTNLPDVDLLIRTSGDLRISNFLLWQCAYAELWFAEVDWPDFTTDHLQQALQSFQQRERRFGGLKTK